MSHYGCPGPGGSLGQCALCGENFLREVVLGDRVKSLTVDQAAGITMYAHDRCIKKYLGGKDATIEATSLPPESPLRKAYERGLKK